MQKALWIPGESIQPKQVMMESEDGVWWKAVYAFTVPGPPSPITLLMLGEHVFETAADALRVMIAAKTKQRDILSNEIALMEMSLQREPSSHTVMNARVLESEQA